MTSRWSTRAVSDLSRLIGAELGLGEQALEALTLGAFLHDLGKCALPEAVLLKPGPLTTPKWDSVKRHPESGERMAEAAGHPHETARAIRQHHERYDGGGYPDGLVLAGAHATEALEGFLERAERLSAPHRFPDSYTVERDVVYEDHAWHFGQGPSVGRALRHLLGTNVLVYALERGEPRKREWALEVIRRLGRPGGRRVASLGLMGVPRRLFEKARGQTRRRDGAR